MDHGHQCSGQRGSQPGEIGRVALEPGECGVGVGLAEERNASGETFVEHEAERVQVGAAVELLAAHLLGRQVLRRAHHDVVAREIGIGRLQPLGDAEVGQQHAPVRGDHDVARLDVTMDETGLVGMVECECHARADVTREFGTQPLLGVEQLAKALAFHELHHDGLATVLFEHVVDGDDVRVVEAGRGDRLAPESLGDDRVGQRASASTI